MQSPLRRPRVAPTLLAALLTVAAPRVAPAWTPLGPDGGTIRVVVADPSNPSTLYAAVYAGPNLGDGRGVYKSVNAGATWSPVNVGLGPAPITQILVNPQNPQIVFAAEYFGGVHRSTNGGASWNSTVGVPAEQHSGFEIDPLDPSRLYLASQSGVYRSTNGGNLFTAANSGLTSLVVSALAIDRASPQVLYAATADGVFKSSDGASTWTPSNAGLPGAGVEFLAVDPTTSSKVYAAGCGIGVFRSLDGGGTWSAGDAGLPSPTGCVVALAAHPGVPGTLYAALTDDATHTVFVSADFAATWAPLGSGLPGHVVESFTVMQSFPSILYAGTQGGLFRSNDGGATWAPRMTGIRHPYLLSVAVDPTTPTTLYAAGVADGPAGVLKSVDGGVSWTQIGPLARIPASSRAMSEVVFLQIVLDPTDPARLYLASDDGIFRSTDAGATWTWAAGQSSPYVWWLAVDPLTPSVLYMSTYGAGVQKSVDGGATWTVTNNGLPIPYSTSVLPDPQHAGTVYASLSFRGMFKSVDGAASWSAINSGFPDPSSIGFSNVVIDPTDSDVLYVSAQGPYRTADGGASWTRTAAIGGGSPLVIDPLHPATLYGASDFTADKSTDSGATWQPINAAGMTELVQGLAIDPTTGATLYAATLAGVFRTATTTSICTSAADCTDGDLCTTDECDPGGAGADPGTGCRNAPVVCDQQCHPTAGFCDGGSGACVYSAPALPDGTSCDDGNLCTFDRCLGGVCTGNPVPEPVCASAGSTRFVMRQGGTPAKRRLLWRWNHGTAVANDFGNPLTVSRYTLCVYDRSGPTGDAALLMAANAPVGSLSCDGKPCWRLTTGFSYKDRSATNDGLTDIKLHAGESRAKILVKGRGAALPAPATPAIPRLTVQLRRADGTAKRCWGAEYEGFAIEENDANGFKGRTR